MTEEQKQRLQHLDVEIQISEKELRVATIKKQILEVELDILGLQREVEERSNQQLDLMRA